MRQKLKRFEENKLRENLIEPGKPLFDAIKGRWREAFFKNDHPLVIELGCGNGEYSVGLAEKNSGINYVGIDVKGDRLWVGSGKAMALGLKNVGFLRTAAHFLDRFFEPGEVSGIWITFPDPRPKKKEAKRRLTTPHLMNLYRQILEKDGWIHFKTDNEIIFDYTLEMITASEIPARDLAYTRNLYQSDLMEDHFGIQTKYERIWTEKGHDIKYMKFRFSQ